MKRESGGRVAWVDAGRGFAILMVVLLHATEWLRSIGFDQPVWTPVVRLLATVRLPLFFIISGLFSRKWVEGNWTALWRTKLSLFLWIYVLWSGIATLTFTLGMKVQGHDATLLSQLRATISTFWLPRFELWFIWALGVFFIIAKLMRRLPILLLLSFAAVISIVAFSGLAEGNVGILGAAKYFFFFLLGSDFRHRILLLGESLAIWKKLAVVAVWAGMACIGMLSGAYENVFGFAFFTAIAGAMAGISMSSWLAAFPVLHRVGSHTLPIYVAHTSWIILMCWPLSVVVAEFKNWPGFVALPPLLMVIASLLSLMLAKFSSKTLWTRYLFEQPPLMLGRGKQGARVNLNSKGGTPQSSLESGVSSASGEDEDRKAGPEDY